MVCAALVGLLVLLTISSVSTQEKKRTAFDAGLAIKTNQRTLDVAYGEIVKLDQLRINIGNAYNKTSGVFTANHAGLYHFSVTLMPFFCGNCGFNIMHNGVPKQGTFTSGRSPASINAILELAIGDHVYVQSSIGTMHLIDDSYKNYNSFSGFLIYRAHFADLS